MTALFYYLKRMVRGVRRWRAIVMCGLLFSSLLDQAILVAHLFIKPDDSSASAGKPLANLSVWYGANPESPAAPADIFVYAGCSAGVTQQLRERYSFESAFGRHCLSIFSRYPLRELQPYAYGEDVDPVLQTFVEVENGFGFRLITFNLPKEFSQESWQNHRITLRRISTQLRHTRNPNIIVGDFASSYGGRVFGSFLGASRASDAYWGSGFLAFRFMDLPHGFPTRTALYTGSITARGFSPSDAGFFFSFDLFPDGI